MDLTGKYLLNVEGICKDFPGVKALKGVSFNIKPGEIHALCGENGAGKSTLIKILTGAHNSDEGIYHINGVDANIHCPQDAIQKGIACIYQEISFIPQFSIAKNLFLGNLPLKGGSKGFVDYRKLDIDSRQILSRLRIDLDPSALVGDLSVGFQQLIEIGRALTRNAKIIIMDEPTASLSVKETEVLLELIRSLSESGVSIIYISHKLDEVMQISDRITVLRDGENVVTLDTEKSSIPELISNMLGRSMETMYCKDDFDLGDTVLEVNNLSRSGEFCDISFNLKAGEVLGFFGLVGAGRTEIMHTIFGLTKPDCGETILCGKPVKIKSPAQAIASGIGFATEDRKAEGLMLQLSVLLNMTLVRLSGLSRFGVVENRKQHRLGEKYKNRISIKTPDLDHLVGKLSGGNQQKVVIAKWLMMEPLVLIVDEPTRGIDVSSKAEIYRLINELSGYGVAIILVSSEIEEIMGVCDRVIVISEGRQTADFIMESISSEDILTAAFGENHYIM